MKTSYEELVNYCTINKCEMVTTKIQYLSQTGRKTIRIISSCNHESNVKSINDFLNKKKYIICNKCIILKNSNRYNNLVQLCLDKKCKLLTTEKEFNDAKRKDTINIISTCGHQSTNVNIYRFKTIDQFIICKDCQSDKKKNFNNNNSVFNSMEIEASSINIIKENLTNIILEKTVEGCKADIIIKPNNINKNEWLPIQIKSTINKQKNGYYSFVIHKNNYENTIIILVAINDKKIWIMNNDLINGKHTLGLGGKVSIYNDCEVKLTELNAKLIEFYNKYNKYHTTFENANIPVSKSQQLEHQFRLLRKEKINYLIFNDADVNNITYDFTINGYKVQEKVATKQDRNATKQDRISDKQTEYTCYTTKFRKHNGSIKNEIIKTHRGLTNKHNYVCYNKGDNDFYWINLTDSKYFLIIPENKMIEYKMIETDNKSPATLYIPEPVNILAKNHWLKDYMFNYDEDCKDKLLLLFKT